MWGMNLLSIWNAIQRLISSEAAIELLTVTIATIATIWLILLCFTKLGNDYRWVFVSSGLYFLAAVFLFYRSTIGAGFDVRVIYPFLGIFWSLISISLFSLAIFLRKKAKSEE